MTDREAFMGLKDELTVCQACPLFETRERLVMDDFKEGAQIMLLGEAPGGHEATQSGRPFSGQAGKILDDLLLNVGLTRDQVYLTNLVKCRPTQASLKPRYGNYKNRKPKPGEIKACAPYALREIELIRPTLVVTLGAVPFSFFYPGKVSMSQVHGRLYRHEKTGTLLFSLYHPASLIYRPTLKDVYQADLAYLARLIALGGKINHERICHI